MPLKTYAQLKIQPEMGDLMMWKSDGGCRYRMFLGETGPTSTGAECYCVLRFLEDKIDCIKTYREDFDDNYLFVRRMKQ